MSERLNKRIIDKLKNLDCNETVRKFLLEMLYFELENFEESHPRYTNYYDSHIDKFARVRDEKR